jgi:monoamine oxidase
MLPRTPLLRKLIGLLRSATPPSVSDNGVMRVSRRQFVKTGATAAGALAFGIPAFGAEGEGSASAPKVPSHPIAIIGGGAAGLTAAYRLSKAGAKVTLFEASDRFGGRIRTMDEFIPAADNGGTPMFCEIGGELVDTGHTDLKELAVELGLEIENLLEGDAGVEYFYFGGKNRSEKEIVEAFAPLAEVLTKDAEGLEDENGNYTQKAKDFDKISIRAYLDRFKGKVEAWVLEMLDVAYTIEYGVETAQQSSLNFITYIDPDTSAGFKIFGESDECSRVKGGNEGLTRALAKVLEGKVELRLKHKFIAIRTEKKDKDDSLILSFDTPKGVRDEAFRTVVCALPFTVLRGGQVKGLKELPLTPEKQKTIENLGYGHNTKVMLGFKERPWRKAQPESNGAVFTDLSFQCSWETSRKQPGTAGILTNFLGGKGSSEAGVGRPKATVAELEKIFPGTAAAYADRKVVMVWPRQPFTKGAYTCPLVGQYTTMLDVAGATELNGALLFAGEHTSLDFSGYMNGAVESGNRVAREILGLPEPE